MTTQNRQKSNAKKINLKITFFFYWGYKKKFLLKFLIYNILSIIKRKRKYNCIYQKMSSRQSGDHDLGNCVILHIFISYGKISVY